MRIPFVPAEQQKTPRNWLLATLATFVILLFANFYLGTQAIQEAHQNQFRGGLCGACQSCPEQTGICQETSGFELYTTLLIVPLFAFLTAFAWRLFTKRRLFSTVVVGVLSGIFWITSTDLLGRILGLPFLFTSFTKGRQSLHYGLFYSSGDLFYILGLTVVITIFAAILGHTLGHLPFTYRLAKNLLNDRT